MFPVLAFIHLISAEWISTISLPIVDPLAQHAKEPIENLRNLLTRAQRIIRWTCIIRTWSRRMMLYRWLRAPYHKGVIFRLACSVKHLMRLHLCPLQPLSISCKPQVPCHYNRMGYSMSLNKYISSSKSGAKNRRNGIGSCRKCNYNTKVWSKAYDYY